MRSHANLAAAMARADLTLFYDDVPGNIIVVHRVRSSTNPNGVAKPPVFGRGMMPVAD